MARKNNESLVTKFNIFNYSTADRDFIMKNSKDMKNGFPLYWPTKNADEKKVILSFVNAQIYDRKGNLIDEEVANFDVLETDKFDRNVPDANTKIKFIDALLTPSVLVKGGVYYKGQYFVHKMHHNRAIFLTESFFNGYFSIEDGDLLIKYFSDNQTGNLPFWPTFSKKDNKHAVFSAVNAYIYERGSDTPINAEPYNFDLFFKHKFDLNNPVDLDTIEVVKSLLRKDYVVKGFYYKGKHIPSTLNKDFRLYLEKGFVKNNFLTDQKDFLLNFVTKDEVSGLPLYWPACNKDCRPVIASVLDASFPGCDETLKSFDVYKDEQFDLSKDIFQKKLDIISGILFKKEGYSGTLYLDSILMAGDISQVEIDRRRNKVEKELNIYINRNNNFQRMNKSHTIEDRDSLLNLCGIYNDCYPKTKCPVPATDKEECFVKVDRVNVVGPEGKFLFEEDASFVVSSLEKIEAKQKETIVEIAKYIANPSYIVRGGLYVCGKNIAKKKAGAVISAFKDLFTEDDIKAINAFGKEHVEKYDIDKTSGMLTNWPVYDKNGRNVLLSVVEGNVFFKVGRHTVKATVNGNFDIYEGETFGLVGESGSGKTTISRAILKINPLTKGGIYYKGRLISSKLDKKDTMAMKKNIQMIFQDPAASLNERANVDYIVSEGLYNFKMFKSKEERLTKVENMLHSVGLLSEHMSRYPHEFSGGQRQRIGIARALVIEPQLVLADEPISALDVSIRAQVLNLLKKLQKEKKLTYLFIAHDLSIIRYISDRIAVMHQGHIVEVGPAEEIYSNPLHPYTKSLLTAIPQPDPKTKNDRKKVPYVKTVDYDECRWVEFKNKHYVLVDDKMEKEILESYK